MPWTSSATFKAVASPARRAHCGTASPGPSLRFHRIIGGLFAGQGVSPATRAPKSGGSAASKKLAKLSSIPSANQIKVGVIGATGFTGRLLLRILSKHPRVRIALATSSREAQKKLSDVLPEFDGVCDIRLTAPAQASRERVDALFLCLGHGEAAAFLDDYPHIGRTRIIDLSADFRFRNPGTYKAVYGKDIPAELNRKFVYGLTEVFRKKIRKARCVANPGCYVTSVLLPLYPLLARRVLKPVGPIVVTSASGVSGAGATPKPETHFYEVDEDYSAYKPLREHRHLPEMEEILSPFKAKLLFTPHLLPVKNGILSDIVVRVAEAPENLEDRIHAAWAAFYRSCAFVKPVRHLVRISETTGTNLAKFTVRVDRKTKTVLILSALDNLWKGASGQAVQNMNVMFGWPEQTALLDR